MYRTFIAIMALWAALVPVAGQAGATPVPPGPPAPTAVAHLDLAAMALAPDDLPAGYILRAEYYIPGDRFAETFTGGLVSQDAIDQTGLQWFYESSYRLEDGSGSIRSYLEQYEDADGATAGFELLENEETFAVMAGGTGVDEPGIGLGDEPSEVTVTAHTNPDGTQAGGSIDITWRVGSLVAGVSVDSFSADPDRTEAESLARALDARVGAVLAGERPAGADSSIEARVIALPASWINGIEGYLGAGEAFGTVRDPLDLPGFAGSYVRSAGSQPVASGAPPMPLVSVALTSFTDSGGPMAILDAGDAASPPYPDLEAVDIGRIPGTDAALAWTFTNPWMGRGAPDSFRLVLVVDQDVVTIEVQGSDSVARAQALALLIARAELGCIDGSGSCDAPEVPESMVDPQQMISRPGNPAG